MLCAETAKHESSDNVILIHDPSEIRKKYTKQAEHIGKVKDLVRKPSMATVALQLPLIDNKQIDLLGHELQQQTE